MLRRINNWWESICTQCGLCCYEKDYAPDGSLVTILEEPCRYLDKNTKKCQVYSFRFKACRECKKMNIFRALFASYVPSECAYYKKMRFWRR